MVLLGPLGPGVHCLFYRSLTQQENDGHCGQDKCGHLCVPLSGLFGPYAAEAPSCDQKIMAAALQCGSHEMWVLPPSAAQPRTEHSNSSLLFWFFYSLPQLLQVSLFMSSWPSPSSQVEVSSEIPIGTSGCLPLVLKFASPHGPTVPALQSATDGKAESRGES